MEEIDLKILKLSPYFFPEQLSSTHLTNDLNEAFEKNKIKIEAYVPTPTRGISKEVRKIYSQKRHEKLYNGTVEVTRFKMFREGKNPLIRAIRYILVNFIQYFKGIRAKSIDIVYGASTPPTQGLLCALVAKKLSKKYGYKVSFIYELQDIFPDSLINAKLAKKNGIIWKIGRLIEDYTYRNSDKIIVISESMKKNILNKGVQEKKIEVISNWIDINNVRPILRSDNFLLEKLNLKKEDFIVVYAGNFGAAQGTEIIFKVAKQLEEIKNLKFVLFGGGSYFEDAKQRAKNMKNIIINELLPLEYVSKVYSLGNVALITCKKGTGVAGMPSKTWSIMACNTPIIASFDTDSELAYILEESGAGVCVEAENVEKLKEAIEKEYKDFILGIEKKINTREYVKNYASKEVCVNRYIEILKEQMKNPI